MEIIRAALKTQSSFLGEQKFSSSKKYRKLTYTTQINVDNGLLAYNNLTDELVFLDSNEALAFEEVDTENTTVKSLINKWFFVSEETDDSKLCDQLTQVVRMLSDTYGTDAPITHYTVLTTTDCNARCFYCYELGRKKIAMSEKTANDVADFIINSCKGHPVTFRWFGGEPLYNSKVIDIICSKLQENSITYKSTMVTNGYLFNDEIIRRAIELWNLKSVQITLDGTEDVYNRCKAFIYKDGSAFKRVIANIHTLLKQGVLVKIRMNADTHNIDDLYSLVDFLKVKFGAFPNISLYSQLIFENTGNNKGRSHEQKSEVLARHSDLRKHITDSKLYSAQNLDDYLRPNQCMADNTTATVIAPDGSLGRCEHFSESEFYGSIYTKDKDYSVINKFKELRPFAQMCADCPVKPACHHLVICPDAPPKCNSFYKQQHINGTRSRIMQTYKEYKIKKSVLK